MGAICAARAAYDPRAAISFWRKMTAQKRESESEDRGGEISAICSTHPADENRIADLEALMPQVVPLYEQARLRFREP